MEECLGQVAHEVYLTDGLVETNFFSSPFLRENLVRNEKNRV